eukprot:TRINITY_DN1293_c0_g1_i2.p1 TRINITY_DN1293_c0_g1~~TRINITY_DN1293_c0_g1_i2.p1  ORF type:complete len:258 (+),score=32.28 TRINITY_DN1293_c0_g1_i2:485-1258(+)
MDDQINQALWDGEIAIAFIVNGGDGTTFYLSLPRHSYLPMGLDTLREHFNITTPREDMWFSSGEVPLRWNYPVGVLYDVFGNNALPWSITVQTQDFPTAVLLRCPDEVTLRSFYWNSLKQANFLKYNEVERINDLSVIESGQMWEGFLKHDRTKFQGVIQKINNTSKIPRVPLRLVEPSSKLIKQSPQDMTETTTLGDFLHEVLPEVVLKEGEVFRSSDNYKITIQGILPPLETPMTWVVSKLSNVDGFLYVVLLPN